MHSKQADSRPVDKLGPVFYLIILDAIVQGSRWTSRLAAVVLGLGLFFAARIPEWDGFSDYLASRSLDGVRKAAAMNSANSVYWEVEAANQPVISPEHRAALEQALRNDSHNSRLWMKLGDAEAANGDLPKAESAYLQAAKFDRGYDPHWLLANLYFREGNTGQFWDQIRVALGFDTRDLGAAFELCWAVSQDPVVVLEAVPKTGRILSRYLEFLLNTNRLEEASPVAQLLLQAPQGPGKDEAPTLLNYCDRMIGVKSFAEAKGVWDELAKRSLVPGQAPASKNLLVDGGFKDTFAGRGFGWRWESPGNVGHIQIPEFEPG